jgi:transcription elongation GreA/GreB family factor
MSDRAELLARADFAFLQALLAALNNDSLKGQFAALRKMFDPGAIVDTVVRNISDEQARSVIAALDRGVNLEDFRKESLRKFVYECHPDARVEKKEVLYTTVEALERQQAEFKQLISVDIPHNTREMERAKQHGDLRENFEYHAARARQEMLSSRAKTLHDQLSCARIIDPHTVDPSVIQIGTRVTFSGADGGEGMTLTILGPWDSDPNNHIVAYLAPAVAALLGRTVGDEVEYDGRRLTVREIAVWK